MRYLALVAAFAACLALADKPHAVFVCGTPHYNPGATLPELAKQLEGFGFRTTVISPDYNPERHKAGLPGLEALKSADVAIFFMRFLTLPEEQIQIIEDYVSSGKPVVGFRTSSHAFAYRKDDKLAKWNDGFGKDVLGTKYFIHLGGSTDVSAAAEHEILTGYDRSKPLTAGGTLYLTELPKDATVLLTGTGKSKKTGTVKNGFGTHELKAEMTDDVAWVWRNQWGGRVFGTSLGHVNTFKDANFVRVFINGIHWAAGKPVPPASATIAAIGGSLPKHAEPTSKAAPSAPPPEKKVDAKNSKTGKADPPEESGFADFARFSSSAPKPKASTPVDTALPLQLQAGDRICFIGNTLLDRSSDFGYFESMLHQKFHVHKLVVRNLAWSADEIDLQPRPANFAGTEQQLTIEKADVIFAAFGFNESFKGELGLPSFRDRLGAYLKTLKASAFNGETGPRIVLVSPIANENIAGVDAAERNNATLAAYTAAMKEVAAAHKVGFADVFGATKAAMAGQGDLTFNGVHMDGQGYAIFAKALFEASFGGTAPRVDEAVREMVVDKNRHYFWRFRPLNTFYYTGGRNRSYGYLDFLPAMRNYDLMVGNRDAAIWARAAGNRSAKADDSKVPPLPATKESRGANEWLSAEDELKAFVIDERFEVNLFAGEEQFPDIACPIQIRFDNAGRMYVSCSTTYPHVYPGNIPNDKIVVLEDTDKDGRADSSRVFADDLEVPLSFVLSHDGLYVSEEPHLTLIKDTDGDGKADYRRKVLTGFGCEDSHHALHDFSWTPDGDLIFRESIFHHSQVETPYGPIRQQNSGWFRYTPRTHKLIAFGTHPSTNPWGVTFDDWGQHMASYPIFASAFHAIDPAYPTQHPKPGGLQAYSGTSGQEFVDFPHWPQEMQGGFIKVRYKSTNKVEILQWIEGEHGYDEKFVSDLIFSKNLSFIPVDCQFGPDGALYICDWYNPVKGHAQYSLRDSRRDRKSGRIWRITPKGSTPATPPKIAGADIAELLEILKMPQYRYRYWAKRELRSLDQADVKAALEKWVSELSPRDPRFRHHQLEAVWTYRGIGAEKPALLRELLNCDNHHARAAATRQLRYWHHLYDDIDELLRARANDDNGLVRMEAAIAASYIGTEGALSAMLDTTKHPAEKHLRYAISTSLNSKTLKPIWEGNEQFSAAHPHLAEFLTAGKKSQAKAAEDDANKKFDRRATKLKIKTLKERMLYDKARLEVKRGANVRLEFFNPDVTPHNWVLVMPGKLEEVGTAANEMARDPKAAADGQFIPSKHASSILAHSRMLKEGETEVIRFRAPRKPGEYPYLCSFPGHWTIMKGVLVVK
jgi:plastocyanin